MTPVTISRRLSGSALARFSMWAVQKTGGDARVRFEVVRLTGVGIYRLSRAPMQTRCFLAASYTVSNGGAPLSTTPSQPGTAMSPDYQSGVS